MDELIWICVFSRITKNGFIFSASVSRGKEHLKNEIQEKLTDSDLEFKFFRPGNPYALELFFLERGKTLEEVSSIYCTRLQ